MKINELPNAPTWLLDATTDGADVAWDSDQHNYIVWRGGVWCGGVWRGEKLTENLWTVSGLRWPITISQTRMQVGCEIHAFTDWGRFDDVAINKMDRGALKFWRTHKAHLLALCAARSEP